MEGVKGTPPQRSVARLTGVGVAGEIRAMELSSEARRQELEALGGDIGGDCGAGGVLQ